MDEIKSNIAGATKRIIDDLTKLEVMPEEREKINKDGIREQLDNMLSQQNQMQLNALLRWAKIQKEKCKDFDDELKTRKADADKALNDTVNSGLRSLFSSMDQWSNNLNNARQNFDNMSVKFMNMFELLKDNQNISTDSYSSITIPTLKIETKIFNNEEMVKLPIEEQLVHLKTREQYYLQIISSAQKLVLQTRMDYEALNNTHIKLQNEFNDLTINCQQLELKLEDQTEKANEYYKSVERLKYLSKSRELKKGDSFEIPKPVIPLELTSDTIFNNEQEEISQNNENYENEDIENLEEEAEGENINENEEEMANDEELRENENENPEEQENEQVIDITEDNQNTVTSNISNKVNQKIQNNNSKILTKKNQKQVVSSSSNKNSASTSSKQLVTSNNNQKTASSSAKQIQTNKSANTSKKSMNSNKSSTSNNSNNSNSKNSATNSHKSLNYASVSAKSLLSQGVDQQNSQNNQQVTTIVQNVELKPTEVIVDRADYSDQSIQTDLTSKIINSSIEKSEKYEKLEKNNPEILSPNYVQNLKNSLTDQLKLSITQTLKKEIESKIAEERKSVSFPEINNKTPSQTENSHSSIMDSPLSHDQYDVNSNYQKLNLQKKVNEPLDPLDAYRSPRFQVNKSETIENESPQTEHHNRRNKQIDLKQQKSLRRIVQPNASPRIYRPGMNNIRGSKAIMEYIAQENSKQRQEFLARSNPFQVFKLNA
ncbi:hypothetical protein TVAG_077120 [Trichomonas vaginalis G3]|uniref:Uncharacterized protein n=1 Tax=Trichomonas vaginalis (strain ATCC PRA-98 / G3) TaxID=412133 RepID=A2D9V9_TRIV3|nr:hypothetical protein TVAGG3_0291190 [Trichomonas vaginalis G3]EAY22965.1 hypothetical protein TVAG_077120 [Trichomonas vaginalis G3]KAI5527283.1 hypothetical protein TVAGG3_0291190 [Trichomonas vaginalis G3]|eukprot:XP_001583951.1 hypothetical protein [Trichomonas vaginalis G3]